MAGKTGITFDNLRKIGLAMAGVEESTSYGSPCLKARGKTMAGIPGHKSAEPGSLVVMIDFDERAELLAADPGTYYIADHYVDYPCVLIRMSRVDEGVLREFLGMAYRFVLRKPERKPKKKRAG